MTHKKRTCQARGMAGLACILITATAIDNVVAGEQFVNIHSVSGNRIQVSKSASGNQAGGGGRRGGMGAAGAGGGQANVGAANSTQGRRGMGGGGQAVAGQANAGQGRRGMGGQGSTANQNNALQGRRGMGGGRGGAGGRRGRGSSSANAATEWIVISSNVKVTAAMRERRTSEFRVMSELPGGLRNAVFRSFNQPLQARMVTDGSRIVELNVITGETDINQSGTNAYGETVIAVRPKRPPTKRP